MAAAQNGHLKVVKYLIDNGADVHLWSNDFSKTGKHWTTPLHFAAQEGHLEVVEFLLDYFHVDTWDKDRLTPLHWATRNGHYEVVKCLVEHRARADAKHFYTSMTPLHFAIENGHLEIVGYLIKNEINYQPATEDLKGRVDSVCKNRRELRQERLRIHTNKSYEI